MAKGTGTYDNPILVDGIFTKTINGKKKFFILKSNQTATPADVYVKKSGDTMTGTLAFDNYGTIKLTNNTGSISMVCGTGEDNNYGARLGLYAKNNSSDNMGSFFLQAKTDTSADNNILSGYHDGRLQWQYRNLVRSVNGVDADDAGNVTDVAEKGNDYIRFTNGLQICFNGTSTSSGLKVTFSKPFSVRPAVFVTGWENTHGWGVRDLSTTGFTLLCSVTDSNQWCDYIVIGFWK